MKELPLFTGAGGGLYGSILLGWVPVCAVERDPYRRKVLAARQDDGTFPRFPIFDDVRTFDGRAWRGKVDVVSGGFPCQPFSVAGKRAGEADERNLWPDTIRIIRQVRPRFAFLENVPGLLSSGYFGRILGDLAEGGFDAEWTCLGADDCGAPHRRKRLWILAYATREFEHGTGETGTRRRPESSDGSDVADADEGRLQGERSGGLLNGQRTTLGNDPDGCGGGNSWWARDPADEAPGSESELGGMVDELAAWLYLTHAIAQKEVP